MISKAVALKISAIFVHLKPLMITVNSAPIDEFVTVLSQKIDSAEMREVQRELLARFDSEVALPKTDGISEL